MTIHWWMSRVSLRTVLVLALGIVLGAAAPALAQSFLEFPLPTAGSEPNGITTGSDGNLWFTEVAGNRIGRITPGGVITEFPLPLNSLGESSQPLAIMSGPDGALWFTMSAGSRIGRITPAGALSFFTTPTAASGPQGIVVGPDGNIWFTEISANKIGRLAIGTGTITEFTVPTPNSRPARIAAGADGALWFTESQTNPPANKIGRITTSGVITEFPVPTPNSRPWGITAVDSDGGGAMVFTERAASKLALINLAGQVLREISTPTANSEPVRLAFGSDENLWFTEFAGNRLARVNASGDVTGPITITEFLVPTPASAPSGLTLGPDGALWFTERSGNKIARFVPPPTALHDFVIGFYQDVLGRSPAQAEVNAWVAFLLANPAFESASLMAHGFLDGQEYLSHAVTLTSHVTLLYNVFLGRAPDPPGLAGWVAHLQAQFDTALPGFVNSSEFQRLLPNLQDQVAVSAVVTRLYQQVLGRAPAADEVAAWTGYIAVTGDVLGTARGFFDSQEYNATARTLAQHVGILYQTFLGRAPAPEEVTPWVNYLQSFRVAVEDGFIVSPEFQARFANLLCTQCGP